MRAKPILPDEQLRLILECRNSGLSDYQWCQNNGIKSGTFYNWVSRLRKNGAAVPPCQRKTNTHTVVEQSVVKMNLVSEPEIFSSFVDQNSHEKAMQDNCEPPTMEIRIGHTSIRFFSHATSHMLETTLKYLGGAF